MFATASTVRKNRSHNISRNYYWILSLLGQDRAVGLDLSLTELRDSLPWQSREIKKKTPKSYVNESRDVPAECTDGIFLASLYWL